MIYNRGVAHGTTWFVCDRCGGWIPTPEKVMQNGLRLCPRDVDDTSLEHRDQDIQARLAAMQNENVDTRFLDEHMADTEWML